MNTISLRLSTVYPCCAGRATLPSTPAVPREVFDRACPRCGKLWSIERTCLAARPGARFDQLVWTPR